jgi:hypothetical protein
MLVKEHYFSDIEANPVLHEKYWLNQMLNHHFEPIGEIHEKDLPVFQHQRFTFPLNRRKTIHC